MLFVAEGVAGCGVLHADCRRDVTRIAGVDILALVCVHLQDSSQPLGLLLGGVVHGIACMNNARIHAEIAELSDERVGHDLERQRRERLGIRRMAILLLALRVGTADCGDIGRAGHIIDDGIEQLLHALVSVGRSADNGNQLVRNAGLPERLLQLGDRNLLALQVLLHQLVIGRRNGFHHLLAVFLRLVKHIRRNRLHAHILAQVIVVNVGFHVHQVDDAAEGHVMTDRQLNRHCVCMESCVNHLDHTVEIGTGDVHLVDVHHSRNLVFVRLSPDSLGLRLNTAFRAQNGDRTVQDTQGTLDLDREVHVAGGINDIDPVPLPETGGRGGGNGDTSLLLLHHPVHGRAAVVDLSQLVRLARVEQDPLGGCGLSGVDVRHDTDVSGILK